MALMGWKDEYSVGIAEIDDQHRVLIDCIATLEQSIDDDDERRRWLAIHYAIVRLSDYTRIHFSVEESLMRIIGFSGCDAHIAEHKRFIVYLRDIERKSISQDVREDEIVAFLRGWLLTHILDDDRQYAASFAALQGRAAGG